MKVWEYTSMTVRAPNISLSAMNTLGQQGYELVCVTTVIDKQINFMTTGYFKREVEQQ